MRCEEADYEGPYAAKRKSSQGKDLLRQPTRTEGADLLQGIFKSLRLDDIAAESAQIGKKGDDDDDEYIQVTTGDGKLISVRSSKFEEMMQSVQLLYTFITEMEGAYFDFVEGTAQVLLPHLSSSDDLSMLCEEVRGTALQVKTDRIQSEIKRG